MFRVTQKNQVLTYARQRERERECIQNQLDTITVSQRIYRPKRLITPNEPRHEISNNVVYAISSASDQPALTLVA